MKFNIKRCIKYKGRGCFSIDKMGFTLIEMMIVLAVISLMAAAIFSTVNPVKRLGQAQDSKRTADLIAVSKAIELYAVDNGHLPAAFDVDNISNIKKVVLCASGGQRTCDGQTRDCLVVNDSDFIGKYLSNLPIDPNKSVTSDTGYYISRGQGDAIVLGACDNYEGTPLQVSSAMNMPELVTVCGDGDIEGDEVCDDSNTTTETQTCNNGIREYGTHCSADCSAEIILTEACDDGLESCGNGVLENGTYCNASCTANDAVLTETCDYNVWTEDCQTLFSDGEGGWIYATESDVGSFFCLDTCGTYKLVCGSG